MTDFDDNKFNQIQEAAEKGDPDAQTAVGLSFLGLDANPQMATYWLEKAAVQDYSPAQYQLAELYSTWEQDTPKAVWWYKKADLSGHPDAREALIELATALRLDAYAHYSSLTGKFNDGDVSLNKLKVVKDIAAFVNLRDGREFLPKLKIVPKHNKN